MPFKAWKLATMAAVLAIAALPPALAQSCVSGFHRSVTARISTDPTNTVAQAKPDPACVAKHGRMNWKATDGDSWATDFDDDAHSPFDPGKKHHEGRVGPSSGDVVRTCAKTDSSYNASAGGCVFKYKATHLKGGKTSVKDPHVIIQPGS
jgi:hypothetical protein